MINAVPSRHPKYRTKLCRNFVRGDCPFGQMCSFLHPSSGVNLPPFLLAQYLVNWSAILPQLSVLSDQRDAQEKMSWQLLPRSQRPQLIDEGPSPSASLLLSTSDSTTSEQMLETRRFSRRKEYPCRHFVRTGGWCPAGTQCRFHHDVAALPSGGVREAEHISPFETDAYGEHGRTISGGVLMGMQVPSLPNISHEHLDLLRHTTSGQAHPYQPMYWPNYTWQPYRPYYATAPAATVVPVPVAAAPAVQHSAHSPPPHPAQTLPPSGTQTSLPVGAYEVNGTTYFPTTLPSAPVPAPVTYPPPTYPVPYNYPMVPTYPYQAPPSLLAGHFDMPDQTMDVCQQPPFDPFASELVITDELPVVSRLEYHQMSPPQHAVPPLPLSSSAQTDDLVSTATKDSEHEFPYRPPENQRAGHGHARRISINIKECRASSG